MKRHFFYSALQSAHPELFGRIVSIAVVWITMGLALSFAPMGTRSPTTSNSVLNTLLALNVWGYIFTVLGLLIILGIWLSRTGKFAWVQRLLHIGLAVAIAWLISIVFSLTNGRFSSLPVIILWGYWTWTIFKAATDPGYITIDLLKQLKFRREEDAE